MQDVTAQCGCGRNMTLDALRGRGAFRCGCGAKVKIQEPGYRKTQCVAVVNDRRCRKSAVTEGPVPLCKHCTNDMKVALGLIRPEDLDEFTDKLAAAQYLTLRPDVDKDEYLGRLARARAAEEAKRFSGKTFKAYDPEAESVVYYIRFDRRIKIGTTGNIYRRLKDIAHDELMATEQGGYHLERKRHEQFAHARVVGEWFLMEDDLMAHIRQLKSESRARA